jgi:hypothetical protein
MINRLTMRFCLYFMLIPLAGCTVRACHLVSIIDKSDLPSEEIERVDAAKIYKANQLDENSYRLIKSVKGYSCVDYEKNTFTNKITILKRANTEEAIEQAKIKAVKAGGNGIINLVCEKPGFWGGQKCEGSIECTADAIQAN